MQGQTWGVPWAAGTKVLVARRERKRGTEREREIDRDREERQRWAGGRDRETNRETEKDSVGVRDSQRELGSDTLPERKETAPGSRAPSSPKREGKEL